MGTQLFARRSASTPHPEVTSVRDVVEVLDVLLQRKVAEDVHVAVGALVRGEDVVIRDEDDTLAVPNLPPMALPAFDQLVQGEQVGEESEFLELSDL